MPSGVPLSKLLRRKSTPLTKVVGFGVTRISSEFSSKKGNGNSWTTGLYPAASSSATT